MHRSGLSKLDCATPPDLSRQSAGSPGWIYVDGWMDGVGCVSHLYRVNLNVRGHGVSRICPNIGDWPVGNSMIKSERRKIFSKAETM